MPRAKTSAQGSKAPPASMAGAAAAADKSPDDFTSVELKQATIAANSDDSRTSSAGQGDDASRDERIRHRAYELWEQSGRSHGSEVEHWLQAERDIAAEDTQTSAGSKPGRANR